MRSVIVQLVISEEKEVYQVDTINLTENLGIDIELPWVTALFVCGSEEKLFVCNGNLLKGYRKDEKLFYQRLLEAVHQ